jgi:hypothetical protein
MWEMLFPVVIVFTIIFLFCLPFSFGKFKSSTIAGRVIFIGTIISLLVMTGTAVWFLDLGALFGMPHATSQEKLQTIYILFSEFIPLIAFLSFVFAFSDDKPLSIMAQSNFVGITAGLLLLALFLNFGIVTDKAGGWGTAIACAFVWFGTKFVIVLGLLGGTLAGYIIKKKRRKTLSQTVTPPQK